MSEGRYPWSFGSPGFPFKPPEPIMAERFGATWTCTISGCDENWQDGDRDETGRAVAHHAATRHPRAFNLATGMNAEEGAERYTPSGREV